MQHRAGNGVGFTVINFNTAAKTLRCLASLAACQEAPEWIVVLDNASAPADFEALRCGLQRAQFSQVLLYKSAHNLGFAAGSNFLLAGLLQFPGCEYLGLLNSDAVAQPGLVGVLKQACLAGGASVGMAGGRVHKLLEPEVVDTLGICLYANLMPADRKLLSEVALGPSAGCCLMTRSLVQDLCASTGYCFDARFFCYCEDTDLVLRANLLGYHPAYVDELLAWHEGQASSGGGYNDFVAYHGIRNTLWMQAKLYPARWLWKYGVLLLLAHVMTLARFTLAGRVGFLVRAYGDALRGLPAMVRERRALQAVWRVESRALEASINKRFFRPGFVQSAFRQWLARWRLGLKL